MGIAQYVETTRYYNSLIEAWGHGAQAVQYGNQASAARSAASNAKSAGRSGAFTTILGTAAGIGLNNRMMKGGIIEPLTGSTGLSEALDVAGYLPTGWRKRRKGGYGRW